jgi:ribosomal protein S18 acetylase RimI-like enzyme
VRLAALRDAPHAFGSTFEAEVAFPEGRWRQRLSHRAQFIAVADGVAVGLVGGITPGAGTSAELVSMWVDPRCRRQGLGRHLVDAVLEWARKRGFEEVRLWVAEGNQDAQRLYSRCGFVSTKAVQLIRPGDERLEYEMACRL